MVQDESGRELMGIIAKIDATLAGGLVAYIGLFRAPSRDLANDKALKLVKEVLSFGKFRLDEALADTVESLRARQVEGGFKQLTNHNYLKKVLTDKLGIHAPAALKKVQEINQPSIQDVPVTKKVNAPKGRELVSDEEAEENLAAIRRLIKEKLV
jgi:hypothetical protein